MHIRGTLLTISALICVPSVCRAQDARPVAGFQDGFFVQSADGANRLVFGLVAQVDEKFSVDHPAPITDTFTIRKMRPTLSGRVARYFDFKVMPDFGNGTASIQDAYIDLRLSPKFRFRGGKDKTPVGYELLIGDAYVLFAERSLASSLVPNRDVGVQALGDLYSGKVSYAAGVFNGVPDGASSVTDTDTNSGKDVAGRIVVQPFRTRATPGGAVNRLGFQLGGSYGKEEAALPSFRTSVGQTWFAYDHATIADGVRARVTPSVFYFYKSVGAFAEYVRSTQALARPGARANVMNQGWDVTTSIFLTGEAASERGVHPTHPLDPPTRQWGALQVLGRYAELTVDRAVFDRGLAAAGASRRARQYTVGVNWYPAAVVKYYANFEHTSFLEGFGTRAAENVIVLRAQVGF
jgi:phosphate-selective porin OprO/OprP